MHPSIAPFGKDIFFLESDEPGTVHRYPFYADGFAGLIYSSSEQPFHLQPKNLELSDFYLYGQTIEPIVLEVEGPFRLACVRLYPFAVRILLGIDPKVLRDDCYDLRLVTSIDTEGTLASLRQAKGQGEIVDILGGYITALLRDASRNPDHRVTLATNLILKSKGAMTIGEVRQTLGVAERTLERHFLNEIGITAKQFARVVQFSSALQHMTEAEYVTLTEVAYRSGFADQSHFIRSFKRYTGKTPKEFQQQLSG
jgi:AraC-like DNA-binding protein